MSLKDRVARLLRSPPSLDAWADAMDPAVHLRIGARAIAIGHARALEELRWLLTPDARFGAAYFDTWALKRLVWVETDLDRTPAAGPELLAPCAIALRWNRHDRLQDARFYLDLDGCGGP